MKNQMQKVTKRNHIDVETQDYSVPLCEICKERPIEQLHHLDGNHKNNAKENQQHICTLCHAKIHGIEPRYSELRLLVTLYDRCQKARISIENQIRGLARIELEIPNFFKYLLKVIEDKEKSYSKEIKTFLEGENHSNTGNQEKNVFPSYSYLKSIRGISHLFAGKIIALVDISKSPTVSSLWSYAGQTPNSKKQKGNKSNWNQELKKVCYQISTLFIIKKTPKYRGIYDTYKKKQLLLLENAKYEMKTKRKLQFNNTEEGGKNHIGQEKPILPCSPPSSKLHADLRARRVMIKAFLKDYWLVNQPLEIKTTHKIQISKNV